MSLQDESFPHDAFFDELDLSASPRSRFQFPHRLHESRKQPATTTASNTSVAANNSSTSTASSSDQNVSDESANGRAPSAISCTTTHSDPTGTADHDAAKKPFLAERQRKSQSYQDIHTEYTKRRYKHVESKVGQYIANLKADDERRRKQAQVQRHRSLPEALVREAADLRAGQLGGGGSLQRYNAIDLHKWNDSAHSDLDDRAATNVDADAEADSSENLTSTTTSSQGRSDQRAAALFVDKFEYARLIEEKERIQSYSDYLQSKLNEQMGEIVRLKQNVDYMRVKLSNCEDKLKRQTSGGLAMVGSSCFGGSVGGGLGGAVAGRHSLQTLLYCTAKTSTATQTELKGRPSPPPSLPSPSPSPSPSPLSLPLGAHNGICVTPDTAYANKYLFESTGNCGAGSAAAVRVVGAAGGKNSKNVAAIHPISLNFSEESGGGGGGGRQPSGNVGLRQRSNSNGLQPPRQTGAHNKARHNSRASHRSSNDSAIDFDIIELSASPRPNRRKRYPSSPLLRPNRQSQCGQFGGYDQRGRRQFVGGESPSELSPSSCRCGDNSVGASTTETSVAGAAGTGHGGKKKKNTKKSGGGSLPRRWMRLLRRCTLCSDPNQTMESSSLHQTYTQIPLLESSFVDRNGIRQNMS